MSKDVDLEALFIKITSKMTPEAQDVARAASTEQELDKAELVSEVLLKVFATTTSLIRPSIVAAMTGIVLLYVKALRVANTIAPDEKQALALDEAMRAFMDVLVSAAPTVVSATQPKGEA